MKSIRIAKSIIRQILAGAMCPQCGNSSDSNYEGLQDFLCANADCLNFDESARDQSKIQDLKSSLEAFYKLHLNDGFSLENIEELIFEGEWTDDLHHAAEANDESNGQEHTDEAIKNFIKNRWHESQDAGLKTAKTESKKPKKVKEIADAIRRDNKGTSDSTAYRQAWETYCSYVNKNYKGCTSRGKSKRKSPKKDR